MKDELSPEAAKAAAALDEVRTEGDRLNATLDKAKAAQGLASRLADTRRAADQASTTMERAEARVTELQKLLAASPGNEAFAVSLKEADREVARSRTQFDKLSAVARQLEGNLQAASVDTRDMAEAEKKLAAELEQARNACASYSEQVKELERSRFASRLNELQTQYADAQKSGDMTAIANLQRALGVLSDIEVASQQKIQREQQERRIAELQPRPAEWPAGTDRSHSPAAAERQGRGRGGAHG
ncbi:hypothetical protein PSGK_15350 [Pseudomonas solani]|uniref:hypothetical protein n=1 Tax=Pseudomonas solani TaxID=2731552 RepID=UPI0035BE722C